MPRAFVPQWFPVFLASIAAVVTGVAVNIGLDSPFRQVLAVVLIATGVAGIASTASEHTVDRLRAETRRWWVVAFVAFLPYGLATAPANDSAAAVGALFAGPIAALAVESIAGAMVCCAIAITVLYGFATLGMHPGRPSPEERLLDDGE